MMRLPGPGEAGFQYIEQKNLVPKEEPDSMQNLSK
jgi:hypothetical protein